MTDGRFPTFAEFFAAVHGVAPFTWQERAAAFAVEEGCLPRLVDVPTGLGKTAVVDVWVWALAEATSHGRPHQLGQRFVHAVERRTIVDGADHHVRRLAAALDTSTQEPVIAVARELERISGQAGQRLLVASFHGTRRDDRAWLERPRGAVVITTTATQLVLRVLGQAPGVSPRSAIIHAGLLGYDSAWVIDEPHLATVMVDTLRQCQTLADVSLTCLGATIPDELRARLDPQGARTIKFDADAETPEAVRRYRAPRPVQILPYTGSGVAAMAATVAGQAGQGLRVVVFVNTVGKAQDLAVALGRNPRVTESVRVVTSRVRPVDRCDDPSPQPGEIVVATQTLEAGVDFEVDRLITEAAAWPALVQRVGRLNRYATATDPQGYLFVPAGSDPGSVAVYGEEIMTAIGNGLKNHSVLDFSLAGVRKSQAAVLPNQSAWQPMPRTAVMDEEYAALMLLGPAPEAAALWLHGLDQETDIAPITVAWRDCLDADVLAAAPPQPAEQLDLTPALARGLIRGEWSGTLADVDDATLGFTPDSAMRDARGNADRVAQVRVLTGDTWNQPRSVESIAPGSTVVLHTTVGGYDPTLGVWPSTEPVQDAHRKAGTTHVLERKEDWQELTGGQIEQAEELQAEELQVVLLTETHVVVRPWAQRRESPGSAVLSLVDHCRQASAIAEETVDGPNPRTPGLHQAVIEGAGYHDVGKAHPSWQRLLGARDGDPLLAKSTGRNPLPARVVRPVDHAQHGARAVAAAGLDEVVSHLAFAHHGDRASDSYMKLSGKHPWRLAWQEAVVRLADWQASARPDPQTPGPIHPPASLLELAGSDLPAGSGRMVDLAGLHGARVGAWYTALGVLAVAEDVLSPTVQISWPSLGGAPRLHGLSEEDLSTVMDWVNHDFIDLLRTICDALAARNEDILRTKYQHRLLPDLAATQAAALHACGSSALMQRIVKHLLSLNAPQTLTKEGQVHTALAGGWMASNGNVAARILAAPGADAEVLLSPYAGWEVSPTLSAPDHLLDRDSDVVPHHVRTAEYRLIAIGIAASGRALSQAGVAHALYRQRFLPCPPAPVSLWRLEALSRTRRGPGMVANQVTVGNFNTVTTPTLATGA